jgi:multiple sugar transport system ATP-binding protein
MATVTLKNVKKVYDKDVVAVQEFNLEIADKEFVVLVGPSGCGKSTTLRMIAGLEEITDGELFIGDRVVNDVAPKDRDIAMVFQNYALYPHMTVYENMAFALKLRKMKKDDIDRAVKNAAEILDITEYLGRRPKALSGGQRQRVAIGRAIVREPQVFLMDEPLSNLDAKLRNQMRAEIIKLRQRISTTFVYVTHDQTEAMTLGDRIVIMKDGFIQQVGTPNEVFHHPANLFVAGFIGSPQMNFFKGELKKDGESYYAVVLDKRMDFSDEQQAALKKAGAPAGEITVGVRPEHINVGDEANAIKGKVIFSEMMGSSVHLHVMSGDQEVVIIKPISDMGDAQVTSFSGGEQLSFTLPGAAAHLFDKETTNNLI